MDQHNWQLADQQSPVWRCAGGLEPCHRCCNRQAGRNRGQETVATCGLCRRSAMRRRSVRACGLSFPEPGDRQRPRDDADDCVEPESCAASRECSKLRNVSATIRLDPSSSWWRRPSPAANFERIDFRDKQQKTGPVQWQNRRRTVRG